MKLRLFDLHCDTPLKLYSNNFYLNNAPSHISLEKLSAFDDYAQIMAVWSAKQFSDESAFFAFHKIVDYLNFEVERLDEDIAYANSSGLFGQEKRKKILLSVEDARLLGGRLDRLKVLYARGVRFLIPVWGGTSIIGGAHDTNEGLTEFGKSVIEECFKLGIITDISHASEKTAQEILDAAEAVGKSVMASHSNSYEVCRHSRNLKDYQFERIRKLGGVVGISLHTPHLCDRNESTADDVVKHIEHYMSLGGENTVALGCDFDGTDSIPRKIKDVSDLTIIAERLAKLNYSNETIDRIFYSNAKTFIDNNL